MYKLIACDLDGTLLDDNKNVSDNTKRAIKEAIKQGAIFAISTGRPAGSCKFLVDFLNEDMPLITYNGSKVSLKESNKILFEITLEEKDARMCLDLIHSLDGTFIFYSNDKLYTNRIDDNVKKYLTFSKLIPNLIDYENIDYSNITKIVWLDLDPKQTIKNYEIGRKNITNLNTMVSQPFLTEFINKKVSKAVGLDVLCKYYGIDISEVIACGDAINDLEMIEHAGLGVAMKNSMEGIIEHADYVTERTNNEDGIAEVIEKFILKGDK